MQIPLIRTKIDPVLQQKRSHEIFTDAVPIQKRLTICADALLPEHLTIIDIGKIIYSPTLAMI